MVKQVGRQVDRYVDIEEKKKKVRSKGIYPMPLCTTVDLTLVTKRGLRVGLVRPGRRIHTSVQIRKIQLDYASASASASQG